MYETEKLRRADAYRKAGIKKTTQALKEEEAADIVRKQYQIMRTLVTL